MGMEVCDVEMCALISIDLNEMTLRYRCHETFTHEAWWKGIIYANLIQFFPLKNSLIFRKRIDPTEYLTPDDQK